MLLPSTPSVVVPVADPVEQPEHAARAINRAGDGRQRSRYAGVWPPASRKVHGLQQQDSAQPARPGDQSDGQKGRVRGQPFDDLHARSFPRSLACGKSVFFSEKRCVNPRKTEAERRAEEAEARAALAEERQRYLEGLLAGRAVA